MIRVVTYIFALAMVLQLIRPIGLPGLRKRSDAWKLAAAALVTFAIVALTKEG